MKNKNILKQLINPKICLIIALLLAVLLAWSFRGSLIDDAYISFRYAKNFINGHGFVFNIGEKVEGYTSSQTELYDFNFADYAEYSGGLGIKVTDPALLEEAFDKALSFSRATIVDIDSDPRRFI